MFLSNILILDFRFITGNFLFFRGGRGEEEEEEEARFKGKEIPEVKFLNNLVKK